MGRALFAALDHPGSLRRALRVGIGVLRLRIDADQPAWRIEDGELRVSNIQTGTFAGPAGSPVGQHRHRPDLAVRTPQATRRLYSPSFGLAEAVLRAVPDPTCMLASGWWASRSSPRLVR